MGEDQENLSRHVPRLTAIEGLKLVEAERIKARAEREKLRLDQLAQWLVDQCLTWTKAKAQGDYV